MVFRFFRCCRVFVVTVAVVVVVLVVVIVNIVHYFAFLSNVLGRYSLSMGFNGIMHRTYMNMADDDDDDIVIYLLNSYS